VRRGHPTDIRADDCQAERKTISGYGMSIDLPSGWAGRIFKRDVESAPVLRAANFPTYLGIWSLSRSNVSAEMPNGGIFIELADLELPVPNSSREGWVRATLPVEILRSDLGTFEGVATPAFALRNLVINGRSATCHSSTIRPIGPSRTSPSGSCPPTGS